MKLTKKRIKDILFYGFIIFLFTPYGTGTRAKLTQGVTYIKTIIFAPKVEEVSVRKQISSLNMQLKTISNGTDFNLKDQKGKVILLNYWATTCPPCVGEMPSLQSLYNDYKDKVVFAFLTNEGQERVGRFYNANNYNLPTYNIVSETAPEFSVRTIPTTFIIDKNGKLALKEKGASNWNSTSVRKLLDDLLKE